MRSLLCSVLLATVLAKVYAAVGPATELVIINKNVEPDGFNRSCVATVLAVSVIT
jgi:hypothetical protein